MRITLVLLFVILAHTLNAQCHLPALKKEMKDAHGRMEPDAYTVYLEKLDADAVAKNDNCSSAIINESLSTFYYERDAQKSIGYREKAARLFAAAGDKINAIFCRQNIAFVYDEQLHDYPQALKQALAALNEWDWLGDTLQQANMYKYIGYLYGKLGNPTKGMENIAKAIELYKSKDFGSGLAVSYFDCATIQFEQKNYPIAVTMLQLAKKYWNTENNAGRIVGVNNFLLRIFILLEDYTQATDVYNDNLDLIDKEGVYWKDKLHFHQYAREYLRNTGEPASADKHAAEYKALKASLEKKGIKAE
jgi:tetratricopeptide (TPR) repeat protein